MKFNILIYKDNQILEPFWFKEYGNEVLIARWDGTTKLDEFGEKDLRDVVAAIIKWFGGFDKMEIRSL